MKKLTSLSLISLGLAASLSCYANTQQVNQLQTQVEQKAKALSMAASEYQQALDQLRVEQQKATSASVQAPAAKPAQAMPAAAPVKPQPIVAQAGNPANIPPKVTQTNYQAPQTGEKTIAYCANGTQEVVTKGKTACLNSGVKKYQVQTHYHAD